MNYHNIIISSVDESSIAKEAGIESGDILISVNGNEVIDIFDYGFFTAKENLLLEIKKADGEIWEIEIDKDEYEDLGMNFELPLMDEAKSCKNKCIFCFIDQLPEGMRNTLYFKDDDSRLSFLSGNYITMTNMSRKDLDRIIKYRMSPINVSVHTTNPKLREFMLRNKFAGNIMENLKYICDSGLLINCQIVLCRGINDGSELDKTINDLLSLYPGINSISVVPVGLTRFRKHLFPLKPFNKTSSEEIIDQLEKYQKLCRKEYGHGIIYASDEFYLMAGRQLPTYEQYDDFPQIENGVGMATTFIDEFSNELEKRKNQNFSNVKGGSIVTGTLFHPIIKKLVKDINVLLGHDQINLYAVKNDFFGHNVTVTGLLTGKDIVNQLSGKGLGERLLLPSNMFKSDQQILLDDYTIDQLQNGLGVKVEVVNNNGADLVRAIVEE